MFTGNGRRVGDAHLRSVKGSITIASLALTVAIGAMSMLTAGNANALPIAFAKKAAAETDVILVRDRCGRDRHFSESRGRCVDDRRSRRRDDDDDDEDRPRRRDRDRGDRDHRGSEIWTCRADSPSGWGQAKATSRRSANNAALLECAKHTPRQQTCHITACRSQ